MRWPLAGRSEELAMVAAALPRGGVVISGSAGVGKTRLATEAARVAAERGFEVAWVRATRSAATIPLGAFAPLLPTVALPEGAELLARARGALAERADGRRLVLIVDDGQLLDDASAALLHQLVAAGETCAAVTVRADEPVPDALRALWKDELCALLDLGPLSRAEVDQLLAAALGGPVDGRSIAAMWELTRGNALFLRELARHGVDRGHLAEDGGVWRWRGRVEAGTRLAELVDLRIDGLDARARALLEAVAVGGPLELAVLTAAAGSRATGQAAGGRGAGDDGLEALERADLVERRTDGRRRFVDVGHPLHGEAMRARLAPSRLDALRARLADAVEAHGTRRGGDRLRIATWRLESGARADGALLVQAAAHALAAADAALAERLSRAAIDAGAGSAAELAHARALAAAGRGAEAETSLTALSQRARDDAERATIAIARARNLFWALDRAGDADAVLRAAESAVAPPLRDELTGQRVRLTAARGRPREALALAAPLLDDRLLPGATAVHPGAAPSGGDAAAARPVAPPAGGDATDRDAAVSERARTIAALGAVEALFTSGRADEAVALAEAWLPAARRHRDALPYAEPVLLGMPGVALRLAGRLHDATAQSEAAYEALLSRRSAPGTAVEANMLGLIWLARGRVRTALRFCRESAALLRGADAVGMLAFALAGIAQAAAQAGDADAARTAVAELERTPLGHKGFAVELELARAWTAAAGGELTRARELAAGAAELARSRGQDAYAARALHDLCRLGAPAAAVPGLAGLAVDGPFAPTAAEHAAALVARNGAALQAAAERFAEQGALLVAAEAAGAAAAAHRAEGRQSRARAAAARAALWLSECEGARPPTLLTPDAAGLTPREREVALLAAAGWSSREIADRLVVSVRTVDNHLQNAYRKLGVGRRQDLQRVLSGA